MKRIYYYLLGITAISVLIIGSWIYIKYIKNASTQEVTFTVTRSSIAETVRARGEVVALHDFQLGFPVSGRVQRTYVAEGSDVTAGTILMRLDSTSAQARLAQLQANLSKLIAGATSAEIAVAQAEFAAAQTAYSDARGSLLDTIRDMYTTCDDAIRNQADRMFSSPQSSAPQLNSSLEIDPILKYEIEQRRAGIETVLNAWSLATNTLNIGSDLDTAASEARINANEVKAFLDRLAFMLNSVYGLGTLSQTTLDGYKTAVSTARSNVTTELSALSTAENSLRTAQSTMTTKQNQLLLKQEPARPEDIAALRAQIAEAQQDIANTIVRAPATGTVVKFNFLAGEQYAAGQTAVVFYSPDMKIVSDISELNIGRITADGQGQVSIELDAFPGEHFTGRVVSVDPQEIDKDGDKYYRVNVAFDTMPEGVRSGMSADLIITIQTKDGVLVIPEFLVRTRDEKKYVTIVEGSMKTEREVAVGISNGEYIEILSGVHEGDVIAASAD